VQHVNHKLSAAYFVCMHYDWFNGIEILQGRWQHGEKVGYCYPSGFEKTLFKWHIYVPRVTIGLSVNGWHLTDRLNE